MGGFCELSSTASWLDFRDAGSVPSLRSLSVPFSDFTVSELSVNLPILSLTEPASRGADSESDARWSMRPATAAVSMVSRGLFLTSGSGVASKMVWLQKSRQAVDRSRC